jgi:hypothetical protein
VLTPIARQNPTINIVSMNDITAVGSLLSSSLKRFSNRAALIAGQADGEAPSDRPCRSNQLSDQYENLSHAWAARSVLVSVSRTIQNAAKSSTGSPRTPSRPDLDADPVKSFDWFMVAVRFHVQCKNRAARNF